MLLWYGWYGFNPGSSNRISNSDVNSLSAINTTLGGCAGAISALLIQYFLKGNWDFVRLSNGLLAGLVSVTAGCAVLTPWGAIIVGLIAGLFYFGASKLVLILKLDDPVEATSVHFVNGLWGLIAVGLFMDKESFNRAYYPTDNYGLFMGGGGLLLGIQILAGVIIILWTGFWSFIFFMIINRLGYLRVVPDIELHGLDLEHIEMTDQQKRLLETRDGPFRYKSNHSKTPENTDSKSKTDDIPTLDV